MRIIILGAGQVGSTLAEDLVQENHDITIVDNDPEKIRTLQAHLDIRTILGQGSHPTVLRQAGAMDADMLIAVTNSDETNIVACQLAYTLFHTPTKIARVRSRQYLAQPQIFCNEAIPIDHIISPEQIVTDYIKQLLEHPGALQVLSFADNALQLVAVQPQFGAPMVGKNIKELYKAMPKLETRVVAIFRGNRSINLNLDSTIENGDEVFFIADKKHIPSIMNQFRLSVAPYKRIMIAGGGNIGLRLAQELENHYNVKVIEHNQKRAHFIAEELNVATVLQGDAADVDLLNDENIEYTDIFCALTNDDEANIIASMQAKRLGVKKVMALIDRTAYVDLIEGGEIDIAISPQQATIGSILTHVRRGDIVNVHSLRRGAAEAIELIAHGDTTTSSVIGKALTEIQLPPGTTLGGIVRGDEIMIIDKNTIVEPEDRIVLFLSNKKYIPDVERLFEVSAIFV